MCHKRKNKISIKNPVKRADIPEFFTDAISKTSLGETTHDPKCHIHSVSFKYSTYRKRIRIEESRGSIFVKFLLISYPPHINISLQQRTLNNSNYTQKFITLLPDAWVNPNLRKWAGINSGDFHKNFLTDKTDVKCM